MAKQVESTGLTLLLCFTVLLASALASQKCRTGCQGRPATYQVHYETGQTYVYNFEGHTLATLPGQQGDGTKLQLKATAEVSILDNCQGILQLKGVQVIGPDAQKHAHLKDLEAHPVSFNYENGVVDKEICTEEADSEASVNIKRAVLSLLQVSPNESIKPGFGKVLDVFGLCPTDISYSERGDTTTITKIRNLNKCHLREHLRQDFASVNYHIESDLQTTPLLESTQELKQHLKGGIVSTAESHEKYLYRPFSNQEVGAKTVVDSKLTLASHAKQAPPAASGHLPRSIVFEPPHVGNTGSSNPAAIIEALHKAHEAMPEVVGETAAREFSNVVNILRQSKKEDLLSVYGQVKAGAGFKAGTKMFLDALFRAGTGDAVEVAVELLKSKKITGPYADLYYLQFAYTKHVTLGALTAAVTLLDQPEFSKLAFLGVGALGGRYCADHRCEGVPEFDAFLEKLTKPLSGGCKSSNFEEELKVIAALKGLHNVHHLNDATVGKLRACVLDDHLPTRVRVAVLDVFQSDACRVKQTSLEVLKNRQLDSELRIKAFLALIECPCNRMANSLKEVLDSETSYQVGSFIVSYLRNLRASTNPSKQQIKAVYGQVRTTKRFPVDFRKFSSNFEFSYILGGPNLGSTVESNVIYSQKSFLPRASTLNLTAELFGHSVNFLELEFRQENLDLLAEKLFGPKGYFQTHTPEEIIKSAKERWTDLDSNVRQKLNHAIRGKRSVTKEALEDFRHKTVGPHHSEPDRELLLELSTRLFGAEVGWFTFHDDAKDVAKNTFDQSFNILDKIVAKAKHFDYKLRQHNTFLDTELIYPTSLGFPLKLTASGSSAIHFELEGSLDAKKLVDDFKNSHVHVKFIPSAAVEIDGTFVVDAHVLTAGLRLATTLHTATGADINVKAAKGVGIDVTLGLPVKKQDIITLKSEVLSTVHQRGKSEVNTPIVFQSTPRRDYHGCFDQLSPLVGLTFCGTMSFPWDPVASKAAFYPLNGPSKLALTIETEDVTSYHFYASLNKDDPNKKSLELLLETPNSKTNRKLGLILEQTLHPHLGLKAELSSPWKHVTGEISLIDTDKEVSVSAKLLNDDHEYSVKLGAHVSGDSSHSTYSPLLHYKTPTLEGTNEKADLPYNIKGAVIVDKSGNARKYSFKDIVLKTPRGDYHLDGSVSAETGTAYDADLKVSYGQENVALKAGVKRPAQGNFHVNLLLHPSQYKDFGVNLVWDFKRDKNNLENVLTVVHGQDAESKEARVTVHQKAHYQYEDIEHFEFSTDNEVTYPLLNIVGKFEGKVTRKSIHVDIEASYEKHKFETELSAKTGVHHPGDYEVEFDAKVLDSSLDFETKREIVAPGQSKFTTELEVKPGGKYGLVADVKHHFERNDIDFQVDAVVKVHGQPNDYKLDSGLVVNPQLFDSHYKASVGDNDYIDVAVKFNRASGNPSGNAKLYLKNYVNGNAQFKYSAGKGSATLQIDIPKINRKIKGTGDLQVTGSQHVATVDIYYNDVEKNPNQKIHFHTDTDLKKDAIKSKNTFSVLDYKTEFNLNGQLIDKLEDGQLKGDFDLTLPTGHHFTGKLDRTLHVRPTNSEGDLKLELTGQTSSSSSPAKITFEIAAKNVDTKQYSFDGQSKLAFHAPSGKDVAVVVAAKNIPQREQRVIEAQGILQGSLVGDPVRIEINSEIYEPHVTYKVHGSYGTGAIVDVSGKVGKALKRHENFVVGPVSVDNVIELKLPIENVKHIKFVTALHGEIEEKRIQLKYDELMEIDDNIYKFESETDNEREKGSNKVTVTLPHSEPKTFSSNWYINYEDFKTKDLLKGGFSFDGNHDTKFSVDVNGKKDMSELHVHSILHTPYDRLKSAELNLKNKYSPAPKFEVITDLTLTVDDKKFTILNKLTPGILPGLNNIDFTSTHPQGKSRVFLFLQSKTKHDVSGKAELEWAANGGGKLTASGKANYESAQNFKAELDVDSPALKLNKWHISLSNKPAKTAKTLQLVATEDGAPVINGRLEYHVEEKENSYKAGISGNVKVRDQPQSLKAEVGFNRFTTGEIGAEVFALLHLGQQAYDLSSKYTNKESRGSISVCPTPGKCSVIEAHSVIKNIDILHLEHEFGAKVDINRGSGHEGYILEGKTIREPTSFDQKIELKLLNEKHTTYQLHSYLNEKTLGIVTTLPQRVIAAEGKLGYVKEKGERKLDLAFWLDKQKHPEEKAGVNLLFALNPTSEGSLLQGEVKLSHPALQKEFAVSGKATLLHHDTLLDATIDFDVFAKKNQKVTVIAKLVRNPVKNGVNITGLLSTKGKIVDVTLEVGAEISTRSTGYNAILSYKDVHQKPKEAQVLFHITPEDVLIYVKSPTAELLKVDVDVKSTSDYHRKVKGEAHVVGMNTLEIEGEIDFPTNSKYVFYTKENPSKKLKLDMLHCMFRGYLVHFTLESDGTVKEVLDVGVDLADNNFLKTHFTWNTDTLKGLLEYNIQQNKELVKQLKVVSTEFNDEITHELQDILEAVKKAQPDVKGVISSYQNQLKALKEELEHDEGFTGASENVRKFINALAKAVVEVSKRITQLADQSLEAAIKLRNALQESFNKLLPRLKDLYAKAVEAANAVTNAVLENSSKVLERAAEFTKEHEDEIKKLVQVVRDFVEDFGKIAGKTLVQIRSEVKNFVFVVIDQVKALPIYGNLQEQYKQFVSQASEYLVPEQAWGFLREVLSGINDSLPTEELKDLLTTITEYIDKHVNKQPVNDAEELQTIANKSLKALKSLLTFIRSQIPTPETTEGPSFLGLRLPFALNSAFEFPKFVAFKFSPLLFLTSGELSELPTIQELLHAHRPSLNPLENIPPYKGHAVLLDLHHFVTLDGRHFTFKGTCAYILIQDVVDGNFSVAIDYASKSLIVADHHDTVELFYDSTFKVNGQGAEYPYTERDFVAWKDYRSVNVKHKAGLHIRCDTKQNFCLFHVSGFYFGKTRGLLGALDYEPYDDFKRPDGQVVSKVNDFGNSWKIDSSCPDVSGPTHHDHDMPEPAECASAFGGSTPLRLAYFFLPSAPFREACSHIVADAATPEAKKQAACTTAAAYVALARSQYIYATLPSDCVHCPVVGGSPIEVGDTVHVKVPQRAADVVIVVEQDTKNSELFKELVTPLVTTLTNDLKAKGISEVHFTLIGFGEATMYHPAIYTTGGKSVFEGKTKNIKFTDHADPFSLKLDNFQNRVKYLQALIESELGLGAPARAYQYAAKHPFKIGTAKVLVGLVANTRTSAFAVSFQQLAALYSTKVLRDRGVSFHLVAPIDDLHLKNKDAKTVKQIVGFDSHQVYQLSDSKKKVLEGSTELHNALSYKNNVWIPIALDSYGATYVAQNFQDAKASARKNFLQVFSHRIAESLETELSQDCTCKLVNGISPFSECKVTNRKDRELLSPIRASKGGVKG